MSLGGYTTEQCCLRMVARERNHSQFPISILHSQMHEIWEVNECFLQVSLTIVSSSIFFFCSVWMGFSDPYWEFITEIVWKYIISPCYFSFFFPSFDSKIRWLFQSHWSCKSKFHLDAALDTRHFSACVSSLQCKGFMGHSGKMVKEHTCVSLQSKAAG